MKVWIFIPGKEGLWGARREGGLEIMLTQEKKKTKNYRHVRMKITYSFY
jgi:hypothetical protein